MAYGHRDAPSSDVEALPALRREGARKVRVDLTRRNISLCQRSPNPLFKHDIFVFEVSTHPNIPALALKQGVPEKISKDAFQ